MSGTINIDGAMLSPEALSMIGSFQEENSESLKSQKQDLSELLIEVIQQNVGDDNWTRFAKALADKLFFLNCLQIENAPLPK